MKRELSGQHRSIKSNSTITLMDVESKVSLYNESSDFISHSPQSTILMDSEKLHLSFLFFFFSFCLKGYNYFILEDVTSILIRVREY